jgi:hypothetical protein
MRCRARRCNTIYKEHLELDFELKAAGMVDGSACFSSQEKLKALRKQEENWRNMNLTHVASVKVPHFPTSPYIFKSGYYVTGGAVDGHDSSTVMLQYLNVLNLNKEKLPDECDASDHFPDNHREDEHSWGFIQGEGVIQAFCLSIDEHDLVALVELVPR